MDRKLHQQRKPAVHSPAWPLEREVRVSESGQFSVSIDSVQKLRTFRRDVDKVAEIRQKLQSRR